MFVHGVITKFAEKSFPFPYFVFTEKKTTLLDSILIKSTNFHDNFLSMHQIILTVIKSLKEFRQQHQTLVQ